MKRHAGAGLAVVAALALGLLGGATPAGAQFGPEPPCDDLGSSIPVGGPLPTTPIASDGVTAVHYGAHRRAGVGCRGTDTGLLFSWWTEYGANGLSIGKPPGTTVASGADIGSPGDDTVDLVVLGGDGHVWHRHAEADGLFAWDFDAWEDLGGPFTSAPSVVAWAPGRLDVFARGGDGALWTRYRIGAGPWSAWYTLGGILRSGPDTTSTANGTWDVFVVGADNALYQRAWTGSGFTDWQRRGGIFTSDPSAVSWDAGRIDVFGRGADGQAWSAYRSNGAWSGFYALGGAISGTPEAGSRFVGTWDLYTYTGAGPSPVWVNRWTGTAFTGWDRTTDDSFFRTPDSPPV